MSFFSPLAEDIWRHHRDKHQEQDVFSCAAPVKHEDADQSVLQAKQLQHVQDKFCQKLQGEKLEKLSSLSIGEYDVARNAVILKTLKGKVAAHYGYSDCGRTLLHAEEALFLMDVGVLRVYYNDVPLSLQEAMAALLSVDGVTLNHYMTYSHLSRLGYIVRRMVCKDGSPYHLTRKRKAKLSSHFDHTLDNATTTVGVTDTDNSDDKNSTPAVIAVQETAPVHSSDFDNTEGVAYSNTCCLETAERSIKSYHPTVISLSTGRVKFAVQPSTEQYMETDADHDVKAASRLTKFDYSGIEFCSDGMSLKTSQVDTPYDSKPAPTSGTRSNNQTGCFANHSTMGYYSTKCFSKAECWPDFKQQHHERLSSLGSSSSFNTDSSLIGKDGDIQDMTTLLHTLQLSTSESLKSLNIEGREFDSSQLIFEVYLPDPNFRKSQPGKPHHRVKVISSADPVPSLADVVLQHSIDSQVPMYWAVCDGGDISFYSQTPENIPPDSYNT